DIKGGHDIGTQLTTGTPNTAVGNQAGLALTTGIRNTLFGYAAGQSLTSGGTNIFIGHRAGVNSTVSNGNVVIGTNIGNGNDIGAGASSENVLIDTSTVLSGNSSYNVSIGASGNASMTDTTYNILIGRSTGGALTSGSNNVMVGGFAGAAVAATAGSNVMLGYYAGRYETGSNSFYINNQNQTDTAHDKTDSLLYGTFNTTAASQTLTINASTSIAQNLQVLGTGNSYFAGNVGVGTTNPQALLHVGNDYVSSATTFIKIAPSAATISSGQSFISWSRQSDSWTPASIGQRYPATVANYGGVLAFSTHHNDGVAATLPVERLTILADGNVGIGTTSPLVKLQVDYAAEDQTGGIILRNTSSHSNADVFMSYQNNAGAAGWSTGIDSSDDDFTIAYSPTSIATNQMFKIARTTGSVGLSSTTPAARLGITQSANTNAGGIWLAATDGDYRAMFMDTSGVLSFNGGDGTTLNTA
ncbi:MAG: hypothetical protein NT077_04665, partial [Candidatus Taylorbacteria bacterium]|nr:hypothetical protein [Candidatus Taylorbacteria bacterium]